MSTKSADVFLLAENRLLREALVGLLAKKNVRVVGASPCSGAAIKEIAHKRPGVVLLDSSGLQSNDHPIPTLLSSVPGVKVVMVDMDPDTNTFLTAVRGGVVGYVLKDASQPR